MCQYIAHLLVQATNLWIRGEKVIMIKDFAFDVVKDKFGGQAEIIWKPLMGGSFREMG